MEIHRKFSIPVACLVFVLIGIGLGVTSRKDGRLASFALGLMVIFTYYVIMYGAEAMAKGALVSPHLAMWLPNILLGLAGLTLFAWRSASVERRIALPFSAARRAPESEEEEAEQSVARGMWAGIAVPRPGLPSLSLLDWYVFRLYGGVLLLGFVGLLGVFYISTFIDLSDKLFKGQTTGLMLLEYFWYATPQFSYFVLPVSALVAALVTIGLLTKTSELTVMKACGVSLYRASLPIFLASLALSGVLFGMSETIMAAANREAEALNFEIRSGVRRDRTIDVLSRQWIVAGDGSIYPLPALRSRAERDRQPVDLRVRRRAVGVDRTGLRGGCHVPGRLAGPRRLDARVHAAGDRRRRVDRVRERGGGAATRPGGARLFCDGTSGRGADELRAAQDPYRRVERQRLRRGAAGRRAAPQGLFPVRDTHPDADRDSLRGHDRTARHAVRRRPGRGAGVHVLDSRFNVFAAIGSAGLLGPALAAWAPNVLFGASAAYLLLTVRT